MHLFESHPDRIGQNHSIAHRIVYATNIIDSSPASGAEVIGHRKTMEIITVNNGTAYFFVYSANANKYPVYLTDVLKMQNSLQLNDLLTISLPTINIQIIISNYRSKS